MSVPTFHHIAIQTNDLANATAWYRDFFDGHETWSLSEFSNLTRSRLPGIRRLVELTVGDTRVHLFERPGLDAPVPSESVTRFQHVCLAVDRPEALEAMRHRYIALLESGRYHYAVAEPPTAVVVEDDGVQSFYAYDVNGLEFEFTFVPGPG